MCALIDVLFIVLRLYIWVIIAMVILSWLIAFNVINPYNQVVNIIQNAVYSLTEPLLRPIRRFMPDLGGIDISPLVLLLGIYFLQIALTRYVYFPYCRLI
ncbi:MAG: YggT family protein [Pseudomonadota bacterium]